MTTGSEGVLWAHALPPAPVGPHLQVFLDVLSVIGDATRCDTRLPHQLKANLATQIVRDISLLHHTGTSQGPGSGQHSNFCYPQAAENRQLTFLFSSTWENSSSMSAKYLSYKKSGSHTWARHPISPPQTQALISPAGARDTLTSHAHKHRPTCGPGHPHVLGFDAGLLGPDVAIILITLMVPLTLFELPGG